MVAARSIDLSPAGLYTDPNPHSQVPQGALRQADDVIIRRPGIIEPRPGFASAISGWTPPSGTARFLVPFDGDVLVFSLLASTWTAKWLSDGDTVTGSIGAAFVGHASARQSLYLTSATGVKKLEAATDNAAVEAGLCRGLSGLVSLVTTGSTWLAASDYVAYRICYRREDSHDYTIRSAPSGRMVERNIDGAARAVQLRLPLPSTTGLVAGDTIEIYRSIATSNDRPSDDLYLATTHTITSSDLTTGYVDVVDQTPENSLGQSLYTNTAQNGIEDGYTRPPICGDIAAFRGSLFYLNTRSRAARPYRCLSTQDWRLYGNADGIDGDFTNADATVTNIGGIAAQLTRAGGITVGQYIVEDGVRPGAAGTYIPAGTKVAGLNAPDSIEMSNAATGTVLNEPLNFCDVITIGGTEYVAWTTTDPTASPITFRADTAEVAPQLVRDMAQELAYAINYQGTHSASVLSLGKDEFALLVECVTHAADTSVEITNGYAWDPGGASYAIDGVALLQDVKPNRLMWSESDQPEAVPLTNFVDLGEEDKAGLRLIPTRDALYVCKEDGVWRVSGAGADSGWRADPVSPDTILLDKRAAGSIRDAAVLWTQRGLVMLADTGEDTLSTPIDATLTGIESAIAASGGSNGCWLATSITEDEVYLGVPSAAADAHADNVYVFNLRTRAWTRWTKDAYHGVLSPADDQLYLCINDGAGGYAVQKSGAASESFAPVVEWQARSEKDPFMCKRWGRVTVSFDTGRGIDALGLAFVSDISNASSSSTVWDPASTVAQDIHTPVPAWVPRAHCMSTVLFPKLTVTQSTAPAWRLVGLSIEYEPSSIRPRRQL